MSKQIFYGVNKDGKTAIPQAKQMREWMLQFRDTPFQIVVEKKVKKRSNQQNRYYNGCLIPSVIDALVENGYAKSELSHEIVHSFLKDKFLKVDLISEYGEPLPITRSTTALSTEEFNLFIDDIIRWSAEMLNYTIPLPNEQAILTF